MSSTSHAVMHGISSGLYAGTDILFGGLTARSVARSGIDPFFTLYPNLDSPSGFSSWAHPAYATTSSVLANGFGFDTSWAPLTSYLPSTTGILGGLLGGSYLGGGLYGSSYLGGDLLAGSYLGTSYLGGGLLSGGLLSGGLLGGSSFLSFDCCGHSSFGWFC